MIITLTGANFSASNIGTLSTWSISRVLGSGATYNGTTYVDKGAAFSATVIIADGYELGSAGVTVTMGGVEQSGAYSQSGNVITISIAAVTGNVVIKVPTLNTNTGTEDGGNEDTGSGTLITSGSLAGAYLYENSQFNTDSSYGIIDDTSNTYFIYDLIPVQENSTYRLAKGRATFFLTSSKTQISSRVNITSGYTDFTFTTPAGCAYISVAFKYADITPANVQLETKATGSWKEKSDTLLNTLTTNFGEGYGLASGDYTDNPSEGFYTYKDIPALPNTQYAIPYARSTWFLDANKNPLYRLNINKDYAAVNYCITTQSSVAYISACFNSSDISADEAHIIEYEWVTE